MPKRKQPAPVLVLPTPVHGLLTIEQVLSVAPRILARHDNRLNCYALYDAICDTYHVTFTDPDKRDYGVMLSRIHTILCYTPRHYQWDPEMRGWIYGTFENKSKASTADNEEEKSAHAGAQ